MAGAPAEPPAERERTIGGTLPLLRDRNFAPYLVGNLLTNTGMWFQTLAQAIGHPGSEYLCTHDHVYGDECLSFQLDESMLDAIGGHADVWRCGSLPPLPELVVMGELGQAVALTSTHPALAEVEPPPAFGGIYHGDVVFTLGFREPVSDGLVEVSLRYQACDESRCLMPATKAYEFRPAQDQPREMNG